MTVHTMVNVLGTPVRAKGERKRGEGTGRGLGERSRKKGREGGTEGGRDGRREERVGCQGCHLRLHSLCTEQRCSLH